MHRTLRDRLKSETRAAHDAVDLAFARHDPSDYRGYQGFLTAHAGALQALAADTTMPLRLRAMIRDTKARISLDLRRLGAAPSLHPAAAVAPHHPTAVEYILRGANMGKRILFKRWSGSSDGRVKGTAAYLSAIDPPGDWHAFCARLSAMPAEGDLADTVIADAIRLFVAYADAASHANPSFGDCA